MAAGKLLEVLVAARKLVVVEVAAEELKPKRLLPVVDVAKDVPAKGELVMLDFGSFPSAAFVFPASATEVGAAEAEFGADPKLKTGASIDVEKADAGTDVEKTELAAAAAVVVVVADTAATVLAEVTLEELLLKNEFKVAAEAGN